LVLAVDTSASVNATEYQLQMQGIARAFLDQEIIAAIEAYGNGNAGIAVTIVHWSSKAAQVINWTHIVNGGDAVRVSREIEGTPRKTLGATTAIGTAIGFGTDLIANNSFEGRRLSIDVSGDGKNNSGLALWGERNRAVAMGITVNGLAILDDDPTLYSYYRDHVIRGPGSFVLTAIDFHDFARAFREKLLREIRSLIAGSGGSPWTERPSVLSQN
jgi:hypothetical protein